MKGFSSQCSEQQDVTELLWLSPFGGVPMKLADILRNLSVSKLLMKGEKFIKIDLSSIVFCCLSQLCSLWRRTEYIIYPGV